MFGTVDVAVVINPKLPLRLRAVNVFVRMNVVFAGTQDFTLSRLAEGIALSHFIPIALFACPNAAHHGT